MKFKGGWFQNPVIAFLISGFFILTNHLVSSIHGTFFPPHESVCIISVVNMDRAIQIQTGPQNSGPKRFAPKQTKTNPNLFEPQTPYGVLFRVRVEAPGFSWNYDDLRGFKDGMPCLSGIDIRILFPPQRVSGARGGCAGPFDHTITCSLYSFCIKLGGDFFRVRAGASKPSIE